jgi:hypothetical protein
MSDLPSRIEAATGAERELDCALVKLIYGVNPYPTAYPERDWEFYTDELPIQTVPRYTASVDAALVLVDAKLPGWGFDLHRWPEGVVSGPPWECELFEPGVIYKTGHGPTGEAATAPLAILAALLRALTPSPGEE